MGHLLNGILCKANLCGIYLEPNQSDGTTHKGFAHYMAPSGVKSEHRARTKI